jgi:hypothetical protein
LNSIGCGGFGDTGGFEDGCFEDGCFEDGCFEDIEPQCSTNHLDPPADPRRTPKIGGARLDYRRRVPFAPRAAALVLVLGVVAVVVAGGCGGHRDAGGFCAQITRGHAEFDSIDSVARANRALARFDRVAASAPAAVAPDLQTVSSVLSQLYHDPKAFVKDPGTFRRYSEATRHVDQYLHQSCGVRIPRGQSG